MNKSIIQTKAQIYYSYIEWQKLNTFFTLTFIIAGLLLVGKHGNVYLMLDKSRKVYLLLVDGVTHCKMCIVLANTKLFGFTGLMAIFFFSQFHWWWYAGYRRKWALVSNYLYLSSSIAIPITFEKVWHNLHLVLCNDIRYHQKEPAGTLREISLYSSAITITWLVQLQLMMGMPFANVPKHIIGGQ